MAKKFIWRGKEMETLEEIRAIPMEEFEKLLTARERRSLKRGFTPIQKKFLEKARADPKKFHRTKSRNLIVIPELVGLRIGVYSGKEYVSLDIRPEMMGHRLGEFVPTRKVVKHSAPGFGATKSSKFVPLK
jgi:small subunit ribosomal protein S19